jgi:NTE family protein
MKVEFKRKIGKVGRMGRPGQVGPAGAAVAGIGGRYAGNGGQQRPLVPEMETELESKGPKRVGIAFQGGSFLAGSVHTGVVQALTDRRVFEPFQGQPPGYQLCACTGTSAGALVAAVCWEALLRGDFPRAKGVLKKLWLHNASGTIPTQEWGDFWKNFDRAARRNLLYDLLADTIRVPLVHTLFKSWVKTYIDTTEAITLLDRQRDEADCPHIALGATDVAEGELDPFCDREFLAELDCIRGNTFANAPKAYADAGRFLLEALMASGSLDEMNGMTKVEGRTHRGTYLDGAWGENPPIDIMIDFDVDEIWYVEIFPQRRARLPRTHGERENRKEELWQNAMVEQQFYMIEQVNQWLKEGKVDPRQFRHIEIRKIPMELEFTPGARLVNAPSFLLGMMDYGFKSTLHFLEKNWRRGLSVTAQKNCGCREPFARRAFGD